MCDESKAYKDAEGGRSVLHAINGHSPVEADETHEAFRLPDSSA